MPNHALHLSQKIEVFTPDGNSFHVKNSVAHKMVADGDANFTDDTHRKLQLIPSLLKARGPKEFRDAWKLKPSGGILVWQFCR